MGNNKILFRSYSGEEDNKQLIRIGDFMAYMIIACYFKKVEKKILVLSLTSPLPKKFKADILFKRLFNEIYIDKVQFNKADNIFDPDQTDGLWNIAPLLYEKYGAKILPKINIKKSLCSQIFTKEKNYIVFNPLISAQYNVARNMDKNFINKFANKLYKKFAKKLIIVSDMINLIENRSICVVNTDNLYDIFYLISKSKVFIGGDTGFSHFAGITRVKHIITLYGTKYPAMHNNLYFNANVMYDRKKTTLDNYILEQNKLSTKQIKNILNSISF